MSKPKFKWSAGMTILAGVVVGGVVLALLAIKSSNSFPPSNSRIDVQRDNSKSVAGGEGTEEFNKTLNDFAQAGADDARDKGESYIPPVVGAVKPEPDKEPEVIVPPKPQAPEGQYQRAPQPRQRRDNRLMPAMNAIVSKWQYGPQAVAVYAKSQQADSSGYEQPASQTESAPASIADQAPQLTDELLAALKPGNILYASNDLALNSDEGGPVLSTVLVGPLKGAKFIGQFSRQDERLVLKYSSATLKDGRTISLNGYAVDPDLSKASVATDVDHHYLSRWGGIVAASFLEGLGDAIRTSGQTDVSGLGVNSGSVTTTPDYSSTEEIAIAAGKVGQRMSAIAEQNFNRPPTVTLDPTHLAGQVVGILIVQGT